MNSIDTEDVKKIEYTHFVFHSNCSGFGYRRKINFFCPNICAVCGEGEKLRFYSITDKDELYPINIFIKIRFCRLHKKMIKDYVSFLYFSDYSVISVKNPKWAYEFKRSNICREISNPELSEFREYMKNVRRNKKYMFLFFIVLGLSILPIGLLHLINPIIEIERLFYSFIALWIIYLIFYTAYIIIMEEKLRKLRIEAYFGRDLKPSDYL
ncbi:MAG: hypothetical protein ACFFBP_21445 [Promethearchaeota archaeon]